MEEHLDCVSSRGDSAEVPEQSIAPLQPVPFSFAWTGDKALDGYSKKKYVCKLLFIFLLGHDIDFGHMEAVNLLSSNKYTEKQIVSLSVSCTCVCVGC